MVAQVQKPAPEFSGPAVVDGLITEISSKDLLGQWVDLFFYPLYVLYSSPNCNFGLNASVRARRVYLLISRVFNLNLFRDFTFVCPTEILAFNDALAAFKELNTAVVGVSTDSHFSHLAWAQKPRNEGGLGPELKLPLLADRSMKISKDYGVLLEEEGIALRGLFIIDPKGTLR